MNVSPPAAPAKDVGGELLRPPIGQPATEDMQGPWYMAGGTTWGPQDFVAGEPLKANCIPALVAPEILPPVPRLGQRPSSTLSVLCLDK